MMKKAVLLLLICLSNGWLLANHWTPNDSGYEDNMTLTGIIQIDGVEQHSSTLEVGVFCGEECRGTGYPTYFSPMQRYVIQLLVFGEVGDQLTFKLFDNDLGQELNLASLDTVTFIANGYGSLANPYILGFIGTSHHWIPNQTSYEDNMTLTGIIQINGIEQQSTTLEVGVFCGDECRSTGMATYFFPTQRYMVQLLIFGETGDQLTFKLYDHALGQELNLISPDAITFTIDGYGNPINPYMLNFTSSVNITATTTPEGAGMVTGTGEYTKGTTCTLTATAATGYTFQNWTLDDIVVSTDVGYSFEVNGTAAYVAHFILNSYDITATADPAGTGMVSGAGTYNHFTTCTLTATAATGYTFQNWTLDDMVVSTDAEYSFEVNGAAAYVAHFALNSYDIIATADPIGTGMVSGAGTYNHFTTCTLTATAATGYTFQNWTLDDMVVSTDADYSFEVNGPAFYVAHFTLNSYDIIATTDPTEAGMVTGTGRYNHGAICMLTATPASGYTFVKWTKDGSQVSTSPSYTFTVTGGGSYVAHFGQTSYQITATANPTSGGTVTGEGTYSHGASCTLNATPSWGYTFVKWTKDGSQVSTSPSYTFTVTGGGSYVAHFGQNSYQITATVNPTAGGTVTGAGTYSHGVSCTLNATPSSGYTFEKWTKDGSQVSINSSYTFTVTENASFVANFERWEEHSPVIVEIGTDVGTNTNSYLPAYTLYSNTLSEQIYTPEEVTMAGTISSVAFYNEGTEKTPNIKLYLINTNKSEFSSNTNWFQVTQSDLAFEGDVTFVANDWTIITLDNEFLYDGTSNLGLIVDEYMLWSGGLSCRVFNSTNNCSMYVYSDNTDYNAIGASYTANNRLSVKNQIKLGITPIGASFCPKPTGLTATYITGHGATLNWNGVGESYNVMYRTAAYMDGITEDFSTTSIPAGWASYSGQLNNGIADLSSSSTWTFGSNNGVFDNHARVNIYSSGCYKWLIMPAITIPDCSELNFDLALTAYSGTVTAPAITGTDDKFIVLVSTDNMTNWTTLREWNNSGSTYVFNNIAHTATGENVTIDLSAYAGQSVHIAFYVESTVSNADNNLHIDNVTIGSFYEAGEWQTVTTNEVPFQLTGLDPLTPYEVKVQSDCGSEDLSLTTDSIRFTTFESCPTPTNLATSNINGHNATLNWNGVGESYNVMYRTAAYMDGIAEEFSATSIPDGWVSYSGQLNDGTATLSSSSSWSFGESNGVFNNHARVNIYNTNCYKWLVTPAFSVPAESEFSFDLALTAFGGTLADPTITGTDDKFIVLVSTDTMTTWTTLREWNNTGSTYVLNNIAHTSTGDKVTIDLSAYTDQNVRIAFYVESTVSNADNNLHIDNVTIGKFYDADEWLTITTDEVPFKLTGLTSMIFYEVKVQSDCGSEEGVSTWSDVVSFMPTNVTVIGSGTATNSYLPTYYYHKQSLTQQIYTSSELGGAGYIERIDFNVSKATTKERSFDIYMVSTGKSSFESGTDWITVTEDDKVYSGSLLLKEGWNAFALDKPFIYDGAQNVAIVVDASASEWESGPAFLVFDAPSQAIRVYSDGTDYNPLAPTNYSGTVLNVKNQIRILVSHALHFVTAGSWSEASNWQGGRLPSPKDEVCIDALCQLDQNATVDVLTVSDGQSLTLQSGKTLIVTNALANTVTTGLVIEDGAQLLHASENVAATVKKSIAGYGTGEGKWCLIACPLVESVVPSIGNGLLSGNYDLYSCSPLVSDGLEWRNYKQDNLMSLGNDGYLYANKAGTELSFGGILVPSNSNYTRSVNYYEGNSRLGNGWALLGNPFVCDCYLVDANGNPLTIYKMNADGTGLDAVESGPIAPFEGFFYYTPTTCNVYFSRTAPANGGVKDWDR